MSMAHFFLFFTVCMPCICGEDHYFYSSAVSIR